MQATGLTLPGTYAKTSVWGSGIGPLLILVPTALILTAHRRNAPANLPRNFAPREALVSELHDVTSPEYSSRTTYRITSFRSTNLGTAQTCSNSF